MRNPLFDAVKVSIATSAVVPGRYGHRVTILCPQFEIGPDSDVWDEALGSKVESFGAAGVGMKNATGVGVAEAGKVFDKGRNWTSVVLEIVPIGIGDRRKGVREKGELGDEEFEDEGDDVDVLEIPVRVRLEWKQGDLDGAANGKANLNEEGDDGRRELAYWMVLGVGRVMR